MNEIVKSAPQISHNRIGHFYDKHWKLLMLLTILVLIISSVFLVKNIIETGSPIKRDIELVGGKLITMEVGSVDINTIQNALPDTTVRLVSGIKNTLLIEAGVNANETHILDTLKNMGISGEYNVRSTGPALGEVFWKQAQMALIFAFILMSIVVFIIFRSFAPSVAVVLCAVTDIIVSMFVVSSMGMTLSLATLAAFLMLIGYSVDTDIVLTTEVMRSGDREVGKSIRIAMKTGVTMTLCALAALFAMYFISGSHVLQQMATVLIVGLIVDLPATWLTNTGILRWYIERKNRKMHGHAEHERIVKTATRFSYHKEEQREERLVKPTNSKSLRDSYHVPVSHDTKEERKPFLSGIFSKKNRNTTISKPVSQVPNLSEFSHNTNKHAENKEENSKTADAVSHYTNEEEKNSKKSHSDFSHNTKGEQK